MIQRRAPAPRILPLDPHGHIAKAHIIALIQDTGRAGNQLRAIDKGSIGTVQIVEQELPTLHKETYMPPPYALL